MARPSSKCPPEPALITSAIVLPGADANNLYRLENVMSNGSVPCTVIVDENRIYYGASARLKSSEHGRFNPAASAINLQFGSR